MEEGESMSWRMKFGMTCRPTISAEMASLPSRYLASHKSGNACTDAKHRTLAALAPLTILLPYGRLQNFEVRIEPRSVRSGKA